ncbi:MAG: DEAD/DEAH box helicase [Chitinophagales bacterium]
MSFNNLQLTEPLLKALKQEKYVSPTPIQEQAIPVILQKRDLLGCAQTGTGKTAAFVIPLLQLMQEQHPLPGRKQIRTLILSPTRELAIQIGESVRAYGRFTNLKYTVVHGGVSQNDQVQKIRHGVDILVATPGRLLDLLGQGHISLGSIQYFVLDEADRMLDMGFVNDVKRIIKRLPAMRQTLMFSATMPTAIRQLADGLLNNPVKVEVTPVSSTVEMIEQNVYFTEKQNKQSLLIHLLKTEEIETALVFTEMKHLADKLASNLNRAGIPAEAIHGNKSQNQRQAALAKFKLRKTRVLVATDIAARGIDVDDLRHVINYQLPNVPETYVHRIGRTGRAGSAGVAISLCDWSEKTFLSDIQKLIKKTIPVVEGHPFDLSAMHSLPGSKNNSSLPTIARSFVRRKRSGRVFSQQK